MKAFLLLLALSLPALSAEPCKLVVETLTGEGKDDGTDAGVYVRINDLETRHPLDIHEKNDREPGAIDVYPGILLEVKPASIETITIEIDGEDAWLLKVISVRVICGDRSSEQLVFRKNDWMSTAKETVYARDSIKLQINGKLALD
jgi:hypothetical protein